MGDVQAVAAVVQETDTELAARMRAYAVTIGPTMGVTVRFTDAALLRRVAAGLEGQAAARALIKAQKDVIAAQARALRVQRLWAAWFGVLAIVALLAGPVRAQSVPAPSAVHWGGSSALLAPGEGAAVARVICINRLTSGHGVVLAFPLSLGGFGVGVQVDHGVGDVPDRFTVVPPAGFIAVPAFVDVGEGGQAVISIYSIEGVGA